MAQYDVYENADSNTRHVKPYLLDVQSDLLETLNTRVVVPLIPIADISHPVDILNPVVVVLNKKHYVSGSEIGCVPITTVGKKIARLTKQQDEIQAAIGFLVGCD